MASIKELIKEISLLRKEVQDLKDEQKRMDNLVMAQQGSITTLIENEFIN